MTSFVRSLLQRPILVSMLVSAVCMLGILSVGRLKIGLIPNISPSGLTVVTRYSGVSAQKIHETITIPLERELTNVNGLEDILASSSEGESKIHLVFRKNTDIKSRMLDVMERTDLVSARFSREIEQPYLSLYDPADRP